MMVFLFNDFFLFFLRCLFSCSAIVGSYSVTSKFGCSDFSVPHLFSCISEELTSLVLTLSWWLLQSWQRYSCTCHSFWLDTSSFLMFSPSEADFFCVKTMWLKYSLGTLFDKIAACKQGNLREGAMPPNKSLTYSMKRRQSRIPLAFSQVPLFLMIQCSLLYIRNTSELFLISSRVHKTFRGSSDVILVVARPLWNYHVFKNEKQ